MESVEGRDGKVGSSDIREGAGLVNIVNGSLGGATDEGGVTLDGKWNYRCRPFGNSRGEDESIPSGVEGFVEGIGELRWESWRRRKRRLRRSYP